MSCPELNVEDKPPATLEDQITVMLIILAVIVVAVLLLKVIS